MKQHFVLYIDANKFSDHLHKAPLRIYVRNFPHPDGDLNITNKNCQAKSNYVTLGTVGAPEWLVLHLSLV